MNDTTSALVRDYSRLFAALRHDPARMVESGIISINSAYQCGTDGATSKAERQYGGASLTVPFRPNRTQRKVLETRKLYMKSGHRFNARILKSRSVGATTLANGLIVGHIATTQPCGQDVPT